MLSARTIRTCIAALVAGATAASAQPGPDPIDTSSDIRVLIEKVGTMPFEVGPGLVLSGIDGPNLQSPVPADNALYFIDHFDAIYRGNKSGKGLKKIFSIKDGDAPDGLIFEFPLSDGRGGTIDYRQRQAVFNVSPALEDDKVYVVLVASYGSTLPEVPAHAYGALPSPVSGPCCINPFPPFEPGGFIMDLYNIDPTETTSFFLPFPYPGVEYQIIYEYTLRANRLRDPRPIAIFESQGGPLHHGSAMLTLEDGRILYVTGDAVPFGLAGLDAPQDPGSHLSKLLIVDPETGAWEVAASGLRNVQHMEIMKSRMTGEDYLAFADIGGWTAEEVNAAPLADLLDTSVIENFGWGIGYDGQAREGTFYVGPGVAFSLGTPPVLGPAPVPEAGFIQPHAQYERPDNGDPNGGVAASGPVSSQEFNELTFMFSDLASGILYGTTEEPDVVDTTVYALTLVDGSGTEYASFHELTGLPRVDARMFRFPDGAAGVILEATGDYYRLTELRN